MRKTPVVYVTCAYCKQRYAGKVPKGGDGSVLYPRRHTKGYSWRSLVPKNEREICPGVYMEAIL